MYLEVGNDTQGAREQGFVVLEESDESVLLMVGQMRTAKDHRPVIMLAVFVGRNTLVLTVEGLLDGRRDNRFFRSNWLDSVGMVPTRTHGDGKAIPRDNPTTKIHHELELGDDASTKDDIMATGSMIFHICANNNSLVVSEVGQTTFEDRDLVDG